MDPEPLTLTLLNLFSQHSHYADIMKLAWKSTQRLSALPRGSQEDGGRRCLPTHFPHKIGRLKAKPRGGCQSRSYYVLCWTLSWKAELIKMKKIIKNQICTELKLLPNTLTAFILFHNGEKERVSSLRAAMINYSLLKMLIKCPQCYKNTYFLLIQVYVICFANLCFLVFVSIYWFIVWFSWMRSHQTDREEKNHAVFVLPSNFAIFY